MTTGERIKKLRKEHKLTQEELGKMLGVQKAAIQKYEKGTVTNIKKESILKLADILGTTPEYILGWDGAASGLEPVSAADFVKVPVIGRVAAGISCFAENNIVDYESVLKSDVRQRAVRVSARCRRQHVPHAYGKRPCACALPDDR